MVNIQPNLKLIILFLWKKINLQSCEQYLPKVKKSYKWLQHYISHKAVSNFFMRLSYSFSISTNQPLDNFKCFKSWGRFQRGGAFEGHLIITTKTMKQLCQPLLVPLITKIFHQGNLVYNYSWQATIQWKTDTIKKYWDKKKKSVEGLYDMSISIINCRCHQHD